MQRRKRVVGKPSVLWPPAEIARGGVPAETFGPGPEEEFAARHLQPLVDARELERAARRVVGVHSARVLRNDGECLPYRVRVVVQGSRRTAVAKDIQSAWFAVWNLYVPRSVFAVTAVRSPLDLGSQPRRLQLCNLSFQRTPADVSATVALFARGRTLQGRAAVPLLTADLRRLAAEATLEAVRAALPVGDALELLELRRVTLGGAPALLCALAGGRGTLLGICQVRGDEREAAVRAVLDAANRVLARAETD